MIWAAIWGAAAGYGLYLLIRVWLRPQPGVATMIARIDSGSRSMQTRTVTQLELEHGAPSGVQGGMAKLGDRLEVLAADRGWRLGRVRADLAIMNRSVGSFLAMKTVLGLVFFLLAPVLWSFLRVAGIPVSPAIPALAAVVLGVFAFFVPDLALRGEATQRRREFRRVVGIFLDLVAMNLAGGRGLPEALLTASTISEQWALVRIPAGTGQRPAVRHNAVGSARRPRQGGRRRGVERPVGRASTGRRRRRQDPPVTQRSGGDSSPARTGRRRG